MGGLFSGRLDFIANKKDFDFEIDLYELTPQAKYVELSKYWSRASYVSERSHRKVLAAGKRQQLDFSSIRLMSRQLASGQPPGCSAQRDQRTGKAAQPRSR